MLSLEALVPEQVLNSSETYIGNSSLLMLLLEAQALL